MTSMTGYGYEEQAIQNAVVSVEIKSVNSRFLDLTVNLPPFLNQLESYFRSLISEKVLINIYLLTPKEYRLQKITQIFIHI